jgi:hypothetical protein
MADPDNPANGAAPPSETSRSLRQIAEDAYDTALDAQEAGEANSSDDSGGQEEQPRDKFGRFQSKASDEDPGEAADQDGPPSPESQKAAQPQVHPAPDQGRSSEPPANWSAEDRQSFSKLPQEAQSFLLRRHSEMEGDYQRRVQATAQADSFVRSLAPIFSDPVVAGSLQQNGIGPGDAIREWAGMHRRAMSPNLNDRLSLVAEIAQRCGVDPAALAPSRSGPPPGLTDQDLADPAIKFFADHIGQTSSRVQAIEGLIQNMQRQDAERQSAEALKVTRWGIDSFAEEKGQDGRPLHPDFDAVLPQIIELFQANPGRDLRETYEAARWMNPAIRDRLLAAQRQGVEQQASNQRARAAVRGNARGITSPVTKPGEPGAQGSLRDVIEAAADEIGF